MLAVTGPSGDTLLLSLLVCTAANVTGSPRAPTPPLPLAGEARADGGGALGFWSVRAGNESWLQRSAAQALGIELIQATRTVCECVSVSV